MQNDDIANRNICSISNNEDISEIWELKRICRQWSTWYRKGVQEYGNHYLDLSTFQDKDSCKGERDSSGENVHLVE